jgi:hypothetical protein
MSVQPTLFDSGAMARSAILSDCGRYRYELRRTWGDGGPVNFIMLNPSTADDTADDPTIRKCVGFARRWGFGGIIVTNLFAWRSTDPKGVGTKPEHGGPENLWHVVAAAREARRVVCAWGAQPKVGACVLFTMTVLREAGITPYRIGPPTKDGHPSHPLMLAYSRPLEPFS